ncbi:MFS general substrate transporter [Thozetella sp. PMI_491]|nr:MFS general substrate transporter [Thozetella sp. PMI_491]
MPDSSPAAAADEPQAICWNGENDPERPYNWPLWRKITIATIYSSSQVITIMTASVIAPAMKRIAADLGMNDSTIQLSFSVYFLGLGFAPFAVAPMSEVYGRKPSMGRLLSAAGGSVGVTLTGPVLGDMFTAEHRGMAKAIASILPCLGPAIGPILGGSVAQRIAWQWLFWILSIAEAAVAILGVLLIKETYPLVLLDRKSKLAAKQAGFPTIPSEERRREFLRRVKGGLARPVRMIVRRPINQVLALILALDFGIYTLYGQTETQSSLHYIAIAIGSTLAAQLGGRLMDKLWAMMKRRKPDSEPVPEWRIPHMVPAAVVFPLALVWYGWSAEYALDWPIIDASQGPYAYRLDEFTDHAASASAATRIFTYILGFTFPLFAPRLYATLGYGWGNSLLAFLFYLLGLPIIALLWLSGARLRAVGR